VTASTFSGNDAVTSGGGLTVIDRLVLINSTVSTNRTDGSGGGLYVWNGGTASLYNVTLAGNSADADYNGTGVGGGIAVSGTAHLYNTLIGNNINRTNPIIIPQPTDDCAGPVTSHDYNLIEDTDGCTILNNNATNELGADPALGLLQLNGGETATRALLPGSPAIDEGNSEACVAPTPQGGITILTTDQRGRPRHADGDGDGSGRCDIGAYEVTLDLFLPILLR
jgi:hypothetical protein